MTLWNIFPCPELLICHQKSSMKTFHIVLE
jgi:hypothetical protein